MYLLTVALFSVIRAGLRNARHEYVANGPRAGGITHECVLVILAKSTVQARSIGATPEDQNGRRISLNRHAPDPDVIASLCRRTRPSPGTGWNARGRVINELGAGVLRKGTEESLLGRDVRRSTGIAPAATREPRPDRTRVRS